MKTKLFAAICLVTNLILLAMDAFFIVDTLTRPTDGESYFVVFCFLVAGVFGTFLIVLAVKSFTKGIYFLNEILFDEEGRLAKIPLIIFSFITILGLAAGLYYSLALMSVVPAGNIERVGAELIVATGSLLFFNGFLGPLYVILFRKEPRAFRGK